MVQAARQDRREVAAEDLVPALQTRALAALRRQLKIIERAQRSAGGYDEDLAAMSANLARSIATLCAEVRKQQIHADRVVAALGEKERDELIAAYAADMGPERRARLRAVLDAQDAADGGLLR